MRHVSAPCSCVVLAVVLVMAAVVVASADAPKATEGEASAAAGGPATPAPAADPGIEALRAARAFFRAVDDADDKAAYAMTAQAYREANTPEAFADAMAALRRVGAVELKPTPPLSGWVLVKPKENEPRRAMFTTVPGTGKRGGGGGPIELAGVALVEVEGRWLVAEVRDALTIVEAAEFTSPLVKRRRRGESRHVATAVRGVVTEAKGGSVTLKPDNVPGDPAPDRRGRTFKVDADTQVLVPLPGIREMLTADGQTIIPSRLGAAADLRPGVIVAVEPADDDERAASVQIRPATPEPPDAGNPGL